MTHANRPSPYRLRAALLAFLLLSLLARASGVAAEDDCEKTGHDGETRSCTFTEEIRDCFEDAQDSWEECMEDALEIDGFFERWVARIGCEAGQFVNNVACVVSITGDWAL